MFAAAKNTSPASQFYNPFTYYGQATNYYSNCWPPPVTAQYCKLAIRCLRQLLARPPAVSSLRSLGPPAARFARPPPPPLATLASPSPTALGCKTAQTFSKTSASMASEVEEAGLTWPISLQRPS